MTTAGSQPPGSQRVQQAQRKSFAVGLQFGWFGMDVKSPNPPGKVLVSVLSATWGEVLGGVGGRTWKKGVFVPSANSPKRVRLPSLDNLPATRISYGHCESFGGLVFSQAKSQGEGVGIHRNPPAVYPALSPRRPGLQTNRQAGVSLSKTNQSTPYAPRPCPCTLLRSAD